MRPHLREAAHLLECHSLIYQCVIVLVTGTGKADRIGFLVAAWCWKLHVVVISSTITGVKSVIRWKALEVVYKCIEHVFVTSLVREREGFFRVL